MREVAERLVLRLTASAERHPGCSDEEISLSVSHLDRTSHHQWPVRKRHNRGLARLLLLGTIVKPLVAQRTRGAPLNRCHDGVCGGHRQIHPWSASGIEGASTRTYAVRGMDAQRRVPRHANRGVFVRSFCHYATLAPRRISRHTPDTCRWPEPLPRWHDYDRVRRRLIRSRQSAPERRTHVHNDRTGRL